MDLKEVDILMKISGWMILVFCLCPAANLHAQEHAGQGWGVTDPRQRSVGGIVSSVTYGDVRFHGDAAGQVSGLDAREKESMIPFPILVPKAILYPRQAVRKKWEGQAIVAAEVLPDGSVGRMGLSKSSGYEILDEAAKSSIKAWKFAYPFESQGALFSQYVDIPVTFRLEESD